MQFIVYYFSYMEQPYVTIKLGVMLWCRLGVTAVIAITLNLRALYSSS